MFIKTPLKAQNDYIFQKLGGHGPFGPTGYAYVWLSDIPEHIREYWLKTKS